jgi:predicted NBD/HSP70 family sugar kinase
LLQTIKRVNQQTAAVNNRQLVIRLLQEQGPLSRSQLVKMTDLRGSTLTYITRELLQMDMLVAAGRRESTTVGQKQQLLQINPDYGWVLGIDLREGKSQVIIMDAAGQLIGDCLINTDKDLDGLEEVLPNLIEKCAADFDIQADKLLGIGMGVSGIVDVQKGSIITSLQFGVSDYPLASKLTEALNVPVKLDHDGNFIALAEQQQGNARGFNDFVVLIMDDQINGNEVSFRSFGSALVLHGRVHRGCQFAAGEIGQRLIPQISQKGSLSDLKVLADAQAPISPWLSHVCQEVGLTIAALVNLLDPQAVLLAGDSPIANRAFIQEMQKQINQQRIGTLPQPLDVYTCAFSTQSCARGAALATRDAMLAEAVANHIR